jgi:hypothetical protein
MGEYAVGKGKPPKNRQFGQPEGNPRGKTSEQKRLEMENAALAQAAKNRMLRALTAKLAEQSTEEVLAGFTPADLLRLMKDAEDRGFGVAKQQEPDGQDDAAPSLTINIETREAVGSVRITKPE